MKLWKLDATGTPVPCRNPQEWALWLETSGDQRVIVQTERESDGVMVSTVFLGIDHGFGRHGGPVLFETLVFGGPSDGLGCRYTTRAAAERGHATMVRRVFGERV